MTMTKCPKMTTPKYRCIRTSLALFLRNFVQTLVKQKFSAILLFHFEANQNSGFVIVHDRVYTN